MSAVDGKRVAITGIGIVTPLGTDPGEVLRRIQVGHSAASSAGFDASAFACPVCARVNDFQPHRYVSEAKLVRLMNRDAQLAVAAARLALQDAGVRSGTTYPSEAIGLFGATGLAGLPVREVGPLIRVSADSSGNFDLTRFGQAGLKAVSPILSFKILSNMPVSFVSINEDIQGPNAVYTPWEGDGAQAVEAGIRALQAGDVSCALVGGCDVKTHELAFATLQQQGLFSSWQRSGNGIVPGEGAAFLVLETEEGARSRGVRIYARFGAFQLRPHRNGEEIAHTRAGVLKGLNLRETGTLVSSANGDEERDGLEISILQTARISVATRICPKKHAGDLFAAAAPLQIALGAILAETSGVVANCFGHGSTQAAFALERV